MKQTDRARARRFPFRNKMKTLFKNGLQLIKDGNAEEASKYLPQVYSVIDTACKKKIIHPNNAARKKSRLARALNELQTKGTKATKKEPAAKEEKAEAKA